MFRYVRTWKPQRISVAFAVGEPVSTVWPPGAADYRGLVMAYILVDKIYEPPKPALFASAETIHADSGEAGRR